MLPKKIKSRMLATLILLGAPWVSLANDIVLPALQLDFSLASIDPAMQTSSAVAGTASGPDEAAPEVLFIEEADVWGRLRKGFAIPDLSSPLVASQTTWYSSRPDYILRTTARASRYLFHVLQELELRGMPSELALLPFVESAFNPQALSSAKAAGMWQFIPSTGRDFNLKQNIFKDERRDVLASTDAALTYLQKLYGMFGDWHLALAAYNWGEGSVQKAIRKNRAAGLPIDFNSLSARMPDETRNYLPKLQAVKNIIANPEMYGIALPKVENQPYFVTISKTRDIDVKIAAQLAELSIDEFNALNPQFNRPVITGSGSTQILLPQENAEKFKLNLEQWERPLSSWAAHKVSKRESIETIAKLFNTQPDLLREANHIPPKMLIKAGSTILVPRPAHGSDLDIAPEICDNATMLVERDGPTTKRIAMKVGKRDSLILIARRYQVSAAQIKGWNNLHRDSLTIGQRLQIEVPNRLQPNSSGSKQPSKQAAKRSNKLAATTKSQPGKVTVAQARPHGKAVKKHLG